MTNKLDIILNTCDRGSKDRLVPEKDELIMRTLRSLISSTVGAEELEDVEIKFHIVDDHSSGLLLDRIEEILSIDHLDASHTIYNTKSTGIVDVFKEKFEYARDNTEADLIYLVEDDYLHKRSAIEETFSFYYRTLPAFNMDPEDVVLHLCDYPDRYYRELDPAYILPGEHRHWRTIEYTTGSIIVPRKILNDYWDKFMSFSKSNNEENSLNSIYKYKLCFSPMPTLAIHLQYEATISPYINWEYMWKSNEHIQI